MTKSTKIIFAMLCSVMMLSAEMTCVCADWQETGEGKIYLDDNNERVTGFFTKDGKTYYFNESGIMQTGWIKLTGKYGANRYYFKENGEQCSGWVRTKSGNKIYINRSKFPENRYLAVGYNVVDGREYYFDMKTGVPGSGWYYNRYFENGSGFVRNCNKMIGGREYSFDADENGVLTQLVKRPPSDFIFPGLPMDISGFLLKCGAGKMKCKDNMICGKVLLNGREAELYAAAYYDGTVHEIEIIAPMNMSYNLLKTAGRYFGEPVSDEDAGHIHTMAYRKKNKDMAGVYTMAEVSVDERKNKVHLKIYLGEYDEPDEF